MKTNRLFYLIAGIVLSLQIVVIASESNRVFVNPEMFEHADGTYRGAFIDIGMVQVNLEFRLEEGIITAIAFRHLMGPTPQYNIHTEQEPYRSVVAQYEEALTHLVGKRLSEHLADLYQPGNVVQTEVDGYSGATIRANKIISAIRDALNRGVYQY